MGEAGVKTTQDPSTVSSAAAKTVGMTDSKRQQLSNWEVDVLSDRQKLYAATDAWACINIYREILRLKKEGDYELIVRKEETDEASIAKAR